MTFFHRIKLLLILTSLVNAQAQFKGQYRILANEDQYEVIVRFDEAWKPTVHTGQLHFQKSLPNNWQLILQNLQRTYQIQFHALFNQSNSTTSPTGLMSLKLSASKSELLSICQTLEQLSLVKYCNLIPISPPPSLSNGTSILSSNHWTSQQEYLNPAPQGIDAHFAWSLGITGQGIVAHDVEWAWTQDHEDLNPNQLAIGILEPDESYATHGTAVLGEIIATQNNFGMTGAAHGLDKMWLYSERNGRVEAVATAVQNAKEGDVILLELQAPGCQASAYGPADYDQAIWDLIQEATQKGISVIYAAGNGRQNLDDPCYDTYRARGDHGGILVGAGIPSTLSPTSFSSFGSRVNLQAWGESVYSLEYGDLFDGGSPQSRYTKLFNGTSSAAPLVASAVILIQSWAKIHLGKFLTPVEIRNLLINTGTSQGPGNHIGPMPNIKAAIELLAQDHQITLPPISSSNISSSSNMSSSSSTLSSSSSQTLSSQNSSSSSDPSPIKQSIASTIQWDHHHFSWFGHDYFEWRLWNLQGQLLQSNFSVNSSVIWPQELTQGLYFLQVQSANDQKMIQVVVP